MIKNKLYTAQAKSTGGRKGTISTENEAFELTLEMSTKGKGTTNPEQLFAAGYAACFESTLHVMAESQGIKIEETSVNGLVDFGSTDDGGYEIAARLEVSLPGIEKEAAQKLIDAAHENCPYSKATRGNIEVDIVLV